ncbi:MAG: hypothetical protein VW443_04785 [Pseudomonadales bacterium]|jgi:hypothetical protein
MIKLDFVPWSEIRAASLDVDGLSDADWLSLKAWYSHTGGVDGWEEGSGYLVMADSEDEAIGEYLAEGLGDQIDDLFSRYIDWEAMGRDERLSGAMFAVEVPKQYFTPSSQWYRHFLVFYNW